MFKIGEFSRLSRVSVRMLRHYDQLGLLTPAQTDRFSGYRYYTADQLPRLNRILALRDLGFSLEQIAGLLSEDLSPEQLLGMFKLKPDGQEAVRVTVQLGRSSVHTIEVVNGLQPGDQVILSDTSAWDAFDRIRLD